MAHPLVALLGQRILGLAPGCEDVNDHDELRRDRALSTAMGRVECARSDCEPLAGKSTLNRMELSANGRDPSNSPYSFILDLTSFFSCFGMENRRFQPVFGAYFRTLGRVPGTDVRGS